mmetsp:Transcript_2259/g.8722  ORF Transcript_2259/g.8722 Transcript_2259/m.8722 type:complete len:291 (-) Transcript_2259:1137-2009(-)
MGDAVGLCSNRSGVALALDCGAAAPLLTRRWAILKRLAPCEPPRRSGPIAWEAGLWTMAPLDRLRAAAPAEARPDDAGARNPAANAFRLLAPAAAAAGPWAEGFAGCNCPGSMGRPTGLLPALLAESPERMTSAAVDSPCAAQRPCTKGASADPDAEGGRGAPCPAASERRCSLGGSTGGTTPRRSARPPPGRRLPAWAGSAPPRPPPGAFAMLFLLGLSPTSRSVKALPPAAEVAAAAAKLRPARTAAAPLEAQSLPALAPPAGDPALRLLRRAGAVEGIATSEPPRPV